MVEVLLVYRRGDRLDRHDVDDHFRMVLRPRLLVFLLKIEQVPSFCFFFDGRVDKPGFFEAGAVERAVAGEDAHFCLVEDEGKVPVPPPPRAGVEVRGERRELLDELADGREGGLPDDCVERHGRDASADGIGDGRHRGGEGGHGVRGGGRLLFLLEN